MVGRVFDTLGEYFSPGAVNKRMTFYFSIGETKKTVTLDGQGCSIENGKTVESADCVCKTDADFFLKIWNQGYMPGMKDFLSGVIKSNNPNALKDFLKAFPRT